MSIQNIASNALLDTRDESDRVCMSIAGINALFEAINVLSRDAKYHEMTINGLSHLGQIVSGVVHSDISELGENAASAIQDEHKPALTASMLERVSDLEHQPDGLDIFTFWQGLAKYAPEEMRKTLDGIPNECLAHLVSEMAQKLKF